MEWIYAETDLVTGTSALPIETLRLQSSLAFRMRLWSLVFEFWFISQDPPWKSLLSELYFMCGGALVSRRHHKSHKSPFVFHTLARDCDCDCDSLASGSIGSLGFSFGFSFSDSEGFLFIFWRHGWWLLNGDVGNQECWKLKKNKS